MMNNKKNIIADNTLRKQIVTDTLIKAGARISDKGFYILRDVIMFLTDGKCPEDITQKDVIICVSRKYGLTWATTYRYIAVVINNAAGSGDIDFLQNYFGSCYRAMTGTIQPKAFICRVVDDVNMQMENVHHQ